jgi:predicted NAD/FAD-binding protein
MIDMDTGETLYFNTDPGAPLSWKMLRPAPIAAGARMLTNLARGLGMYRSGRFAGKSMAESLQMLPGLRGRASHMFMFPLCVIASMHYGDILRAPASHFWGKVDAHFGSIGKLLGWRLIEHRTDDYVEALARGFRERVVLNARIASVSREGGKATLKMEDGSRATFDRVVFACHADRALGMLQEPTDEEKRLLGAWTYNDGLVVVHRDGERFPKKELLGTYDYIYTERDGDIETSVNASYAVQIGVDDDCPYLGTQYPNFPIREELVEFKRVFRTPIFTPGSSKSIAELPKLNGTLDNTYYCGSHFGHGIHEDAVTSAVEVARMLGVDW